MTNNPTTVDQFAFNAKSGRYYDQSTGRFVAQKAVDEVIEARITRGQNRLNLLLAAALDPGNSYTLTDFRDAMALEIRTINVQMTMLGAGGRKNTTPAQWGKLGAFLKKEYQYLNGFIDDIQNGKLKPNDLTRRMGMYASHMRTSYYAALTEQKKAAGFTEERRYIAPVENCKDCTRWAALKWQPIGTLPEPGENSVCLSNCRCTKRYR